jgi:hypothetical protein
MFSRKRAHGTQEEEWDECPYGDYLIEVDDLLIRLIGRCSDQIEMDYIADLQEAIFTPHEAAWIIAKESFFPKAQR